MSQSKGSKRNRRVKERQQNRRQHSYGDSHGAAHGTQSPQGDKRSTKSGARQQISTKVFISVLAATLLVGIGLLAVLLREAPGEGVTAGSGAVPASGGQPTNRFTVMERVDWDAIDDPSRDGWDIEIFNEEAGARLKKLGEVMIGRPTIDESALEPFLANDFACTDLRPATLKEIYRDDGIEVHRAVNPPSYEDTAESQQHLFNNRYEGATGFHTALQELMEPFQSASEVRYYFKVFRVVPVDNEVITRQYLSLSGLTDDGALEQNATWVARWTRDGLHDASAPSRLTWVGVEDFEQVQTYSQGGRLFTEYTRDAFGQDQAFQRQLMRGYNHWLERIENRAYWARLATPGIAIGDVNGNQLEDIYICQERGLPNLLFLQNPDGTFTEAGRSAGVDWLEDSRAALLVDLNNNGHQDLVVGVAGGVVVAENNGRGHFEIRQVLPTHDDVKSLAAVDYDLDGRLDVFVAVYYPNAFEGEVQATDGVTGRGSAVLFDMNRGGGNALFRNEIDGNNWNFRDVTEQAGLDENNRRYALAAAWEDFDNDGYPDLYVGNDYGRNNLYRNEGGKFTDIAAEAGVEDFNFAMSVSWADFNHNGRMDVYVANMFSGAGNRITFHEQFKPDADEELLERYRHLARGNTLFQNNGDGTFDDISDQAGVTMGRWAWSANFVDINNNGWEDLIVANGFITTEDTGDC